MVPVRGLAGGGKVKLFEDIPEHDHRFRVFHCFRVHVVKVRARPASLLGGQVAGPNLPTVIRGALESGDEQNRSSGRLLGEVFAYPCGAASDH